MQPTRNQRVPDRVRTYTNEYQSQIFPVLMERGSSCIRLPLRGKTGEFAFIRLSTPYMHWESRFKRCNFPLTGHTERLLRKQSHVWAFQQSRLMQPAIARMRNPGGFHLPPVRPAPGPSLTRAIELLGACTQRANMSPSVRQEVISLVGEFPRSREIAQQWKGALTLRHRQEMRPKCVHWSRLYTKYMGLVKLPDENRHCSFAFVLLNSLRRRYDFDITPKSELLDSVQCLIGFKPQTAGETKRASNALKRLQRARKVAEMSLPKVPDDESDLRAADMVLGQFGFYGKASERGSAILKQTIGAVPRTKQVARSWQKLVKAARRKRERRERREENRIIIQAKRAERKARRSEQTESDH